MVIGMYKIRLLHTSTTSGKRQEFSFVRPKWRQHTTTRAKTFLVVVMVVVVVVVKRP